MHQGIFADALGTLNPTYLDLTGQAKAFKYLIYSEGVCGWADRLKMLLLSNATIFLQQTPCSEYYRDFLEPWVHYVPLHPNFDDLVERVEWARGHPVAAAAIAQNAYDLHTQYLSEESIRCYMYQLFDRYQRLVVYPVAVRPDVNLHWQAPWAQ